MDTVITASTAQMKDQKLKRRFVKGRLCKSREHFCFPSSDLLIVHYESFGEYLWEGWTQVLKYLEMYVNLETVKPIPTSCLQESEAEAGEGNLDSREENERVLISEAIHPPFGKPKIHKIPHKSVRCQGMYLGLSCLKGTPLKKLYDVNTSRRRKLKKGSKKSAVHLPTSGNSSHRAGLNSTKQNFCLLSFNPCSVPGIANSRKVSEGKPDPLLLCQSRSPGKKDRPTLKDKETLT